MLIYPNINPVAISIGPLSVHWYGLMYLFGFLFFLYIGKLRIKLYGYTSLTAKNLDDLLFYGALGVVIGGRLGYCLFYQPAYFLQHPFDIVKTWTGGMSFHGGFIGVMVVIYLFTRKLKQNFFVLADFIAPLVPAGLFFGRLGNFINGELWGRVTNSTMPWVMVFPDSGSNLPRHPSQLYEALCEGLLLGILMWYVTRKPRKLGIPSGIFAITYGVIRFSLEYFREPDNLPMAQEIVDKIGISLGQIYSLPMIIGGIIILIWASKQINVDRAIK